MAILGGLVSPMGKAFMSLNIIFLIFVIIAVGLRVWAAWIRRRAYCAHDYLIFVSLPFTLGLWMDSTCGILLGSFGLHIHEAVQRSGIETIMSAVKVLIVASPFWIIASTLIKLSFLHLYATIFERRWVRSTALGLGVLVTVFGVGFFISGWVQCIPLAKNWDPALPGHCTSAYDAEMASTSINMVLDFAITCLPLPVLYQLQMPTPKKILVAVVICFGFGICLINVTRLVVTVKFDATDATFTLAFIGLFACLEVYIGTIVACVPLFGPLLLRHKLGLVGYDQNDSPGDVALPVRVMGKLKDPHSLSIIDRAGDLGSIHEEQSSRFDMRTTASTAEAKSRVSSRGSRENLFKINEVYVKREVRVFEEDNRK